MPKTLHLSVINDEESYANRMHAALAYISGAHDEKRYTSDIRAICQAMAKSERAQFGAKYKLKDIAECTTEVKTYMIKHAYECIMGEYDSSKLIIASCRRWFDKANGNSYFSASIEIPKHDSDYPNVVCLHFEYGYGNHWEYEVLRKLESIGVLPDPGKYENGNSKRTLSDKHGIIRFIDYGYGLKRNMFGSV